MKSIGIYHQIDLNVLHEIARRLAKGQPQDQIRAAVLALHEKQGVGPLTSKKRSSPAIRGWFSESPVTAAALQYYPKVGSADQLALHFAGLLQAYPFFLDVCTHVGSQLRLGENARQETVRDRLTRSYGESTNVKQGVQKVLQSLVSWGLLTKTNKVGVYTAGQPQRLGPEVSEILLAAYLDACGRQAIPISDAERAPAFFWCRLALNQRPMTGLLQAHVEGTGQSFLARAI